jgi:lysozyme
LKTGTQGIKCIEHYEGIKNRAYKCPAKVLTIGIGHTGRDVHAGMIITNRQAELLLMKDLNRFEMYINYLTERLLKPFEFDALISFSFNVGYRIDENFKTAINQGNAKVVVYKLSLFDHAAGIVLPGLKARRRTEGILYSNGVLKF